MLLTNNPTFKFSDQEIGGLAGLALGGSLSIDTLSGIFSMPAGRFESTLVSFDYSSFSLSAGLQLAINAPSLGKIGLEYPVTASLEIPDFVAAGETFTIETGDDYFSSGAVISIQSLSFGSAALNLLLAASPFAIANVDFLNAFGVSAIETDLTFNFGGLGVTPFQLGELAVGGGGELIDGVDYEYKLPTGEDEDSDPTGVSAHGTLDTVGVSVNEMLFGININPVELLDFFPALAALDFLTEDAEGAFTFLGDNYKFEAAYTLAALTIAGGYGLVQEVVFDPADIKVQVTVGDVVKSGKLGDAFEFVAPTTLSAPLEGSISYDLQGAFDLVYKLAPIGSIGLEVLGASISLEKEDDLPLEASLGPLLEVEFSKSFETGSIEIARVEDISVPDDWLAPVSFDFDLASDRGQDIAFVIDTTGSMADDIGAVKAQSRAILDAIFDPSRDLVNSRVAVVGYKDPETQVFLSFTNQADPADRKSAAVSAINSISVGGGGDFPEAVYHGLLRALDGSVGEWRDEAVTRRIVLFGDAPPNDHELADTVYRLAGDIGVDVEVGAFTTTKIVDGLMRSEGAIYFPMAAGAAPVTVEIFTVVIGSDASARSSFGDIATATGGQTFSASSASDLVAALIAAIEAPSNVSPTDIALAPATLVENAPAGTAVGALTVTDPDSGDTHTLTLAGDADGRFVLDGTTLRVAPGAVIDYEEAAGIEVSVTAEDSAGNTFTKPIVVAITNVAESFDGGPGDDTIMGDAGANSVRGMAGDDVLGGGRGNDTLTGGAGSDRFVVSAGSDTITDFMSYSAAREPIDVLWLKVPVVRPSDVIDLSGLASSFNEFLADAHQDGEDVVWSPDGSTSLRIANVALTDLRADDFLF